MRTLFDKQQDFIRRRAKGDCTLTELAAEIGISRPTASKWNQLFEDKIQAVSSGHMANTLVDKETLRRNIASNLLDVWSEMQSRDWTAGATDTALVNFAARLCGLLERLDRGTDDDDLTDLFAKLSERNKTNDTNRRATP